MSERNLTGATILLIGAAAILASAVAQGIVNVPHLREDMLEMQMRPRLLGTVSLILATSALPPWRSSARWY